MTVLTVSLKVSRGLGNDPESIRRSSLLVSV